MKKLSILAPLGIAVALSGCFPALDFNDLDSDDDPYLPNTEAATEPQALDQSIAAMRNLPLSGGNFSNVFRPASIKAFVEAKLAGKTLPKIFPNDGGCTYSELNTSLDGSLSLDYHLCTEELEYFGSKVNGHMGGRYVENSAGDFELRINFDCLNTEEWTLFGTETITGTWKEGETVARYQVKYNMQVSTIDNYFYFLGTDQQVNEGEQFTVESAAYTISSYQGLSTVAISKPLVFKSDCVTDPGECILFSKGLEVETYGAEKAEVNYGDGDCDGDAIVTRSGGAQSRSFGG